MECRAGGACDGGGSAPTTGDRAHKPGHVILAGGDCGCGAPGSRTGSPCITPGRHRLRSRFCAPALHFRGFRRPIFAYLRRTYRRGLAD